MLVRSGTCDNLLKWVHDNVVVVFERNGHSLEYTLEGLGLPLQKAIRFWEYNSRYRYHKNSIINKDISPLVGIDLFAAFLSLLQCINIVISLYSIGTCSRLWLNRSMIAMYLFVLHYKNEAGRGGHASLGLSCSCIISYWCINHTISSTWTYRNCIYNFDSWNAHSQSEMSLQTTF